MPDSTAVGIGLFKNITENKAQLREKFRQDMKKGEPKFSL